MPFGRTVSLRDLLGASERPTFFSRAIENEHTSPRPLKSLPGFAESLSGVLMGPCEGGVRDPKIAYTRVAISAAIYRGAKCPTLKTAEKQPKRVPSGSR